MNKILSLMTLSILFLGLKPEAILATLKLSMTGEKLLSQVEPPPPKGSCNYPRVLPNCHENVQWKNLGSPARNVYHFGDSIYQWVGINTISRNGDAINFDHYDDFAQYSRLSANCKTRVYTIILTSEYGVEPDSYYPVGDFWGRALDFACSISNPRQSYGTESTSLALNKDLYKASKSKEIENSPTLFWKGLQYISQASTRTVEYRWPWLENTGLTSFEIPSGYRAVTQGAGVKYVEGNRYNDVNIVILSPEEYQSWQKNPTQYRSLGVNINAIFDAELMWTIGQTPDVSRINRNGHQINMYRVGGTGQSIGVISSSNRNSVQVTVYDRENSGIAEMILNSFDYL
ncbi:hypothetical protein [Picosynechococcus sp. PCC 73109]|uniref:hypothetical protein n=1 Tax=Picosynechococcus sp. PCC 73109 TaxID=374982 RepID=UPI0007458C10|nr:hypothetical protein [Picosynechococcus sp. PCC 73109]AMA07987.1 hypothetical protein AWQ23_00890 [Picosynechococcus sp. PCC 73109]